MVLPKQARFWSGIALLLAGLAGATLQVPQSIAAPAARGSGGVRPRFPVQPLLGSNVALVNSPVGGDGIPQDTNSIAISPFNLNLLVGAYDHHPLPLGVTQDLVGVAISQNNGQTWSNSFLPPQSSLPGSEDPGLGGPAMDPGTAADKAGFRYVTYAHQTPTGDVSGIFVATYDTSGNLIRNRRVYALAGAGADNIQHHPKIAAANSNSSAQNNLYVTWVDEEGPGNNIVLRRSLAPNQGLQFLPSTNVVISDGATLDGDNQFPDVAAGPDQQVYVAWQDHLNGVIWVDASFNAGATFNANGGDVPVALLNANAFHTPIPSAPHGDSFANGGISSYPAIDVDRSNGPNRGTVYLAYADFNFDGSSYDIFLVRSTDGGATWSPPLRVNDDTPGIPVDQYQPWLAVDQATGDVDVSWYDTRNSPLAAFGGSPYVRRLQTQVFFARSLDGGLTFTPNVVVTDPGVFSFPGNASPFPFPAGPTGGYFRDYGDYSGLAAYLNFVFPNWTDFRHGNGVDPPVPPFPAGIADPDPYTTRLIAGTGEELGPLPSTIDFGLVCPGQTVSRTFQICNLGTTTLAIPSLSVSGTGFSLVTPPAPPAPPAPAVPILLAPGVCIDVRVNFTAPAGATGTFNGTLTATTNDPSNPTITIPLTATIGSSVASVDTDLLDLGLVCPPDTATGSVQVCNTGDCDLLISGVSFLGSPGFTLASPSPAPTAGAPLRISHDFCFPFRFRYTPPAGATGSPTTVVTFLTNDPAHPTLTVIVTLTIGTPNIAVNSTSHTFGVACAGQTFTWPLEVFNTGDCDLTVTSITRLVGGASEFALLASPPTPTRIQPGENVNYSITFAPTAASTMGTKTATFRIASNDPDQPFLDVTVTGEVGVPNLTVQGQPLNFGTVPLTDANAHTRQIQVCNTGQCDLSITSVTLGGDDADEFEIVESVPTLGAPVTVSHDFCLPFHIRFIPDACGPKHATLTITSNDPDSPSLTFPIDADSLCGTTSDLDVPSLLCFPPTVIQDFGNCFSDIRPAITNTGQGVLKINSITLSGDNPECYELIGTPTTPFILPGGASLGNGLFKIRFRPLDVTRACEADLVIELADPISGEITDTVSIHLCGEAVAPGSRLLVLSKGSPAPSVADIKLQCQLANKKWKTVADFKGVSPTTITGCPCGDITFHTEVGGEGSSPDHLAPGIYQWVVQLTGGSGKKKGGPTKTIGFKVGNCTFVPLTLRL